MPVSARILLALGLGLGLGSVPGCANLETRFDRGELDNAEAGIVLGEFALTKKAIVDGDTVKVDGLDASLRLLGIDTEETFKSDKAWRAYEVGWDQYLANEQAKTSRPIKVPTPLGMDAKHFAEDFFFGVTMVRLERDHPKEIRGRYNRYLAYVLVERDGEWVNYNVECVRAGMSPYFTKYGYSRRFTTSSWRPRPRLRGPARESGPPGPSPTMTTTRARPGGTPGRVRAKFEHDAAENPKLIAQTDPRRARSAFRRGSATRSRSSRRRRMRQGDRGPKRVMLTRRLFNDFPLIFLAALRVRGLWHRLLPGRVRARARGRDQLHGPPQRPEPASARGPDPAQVQIPHLRPARLFR